MTESLSLYRALESLDLLAEKPPLWWPRYGTFEVVVGAVLTQNSQWGRVEQSLHNLRGANLLSPAALAHIDLQTLMELIRPSGLFKNKSKVLQTLSKALIEDFGDFGTFRSEVTRDWLLAQKGIGPESADSILCYACARDAMVVDAYTARLLRAFGFELESYDALQAWCVEGLEGHFAESEYPQLYARFHGMIVEYVKRYKKSGGVDVAPLSEML
jgi:endonuclease-3 related protein